MNNNENYERRMKEIVETFAEMCSIKPNSRGMWCSRIREFEVFCDDENSHYPYYFDGNKYVRTWELCDVPFFVPTKREQNEAQQFLVKAIHGHDSTRII